MRTGNCDMFSRTLNGAAAVHIAILTTLSACVTITTLTHGKEIPVAAPGEVAMSAEKLDEVTDAVIDFEDWARGAFDTPQEYRQILLDIHELIRVTARFHRYCEEDKADR